MADEVVCLLCGHVASTLARHLLAEHGIDAEAYRKQFPKARIRSLTCEARRREAITRSHVTKPRKGVTKNVKCYCGTRHDVSLFDRKKPRCSTCRAKEAAKKWVGKKEPQDYVTCVGCGHRAISLTAHIRHAHPEWKGCYPGVSVALGCRTRLTGTR